MRIFLTLAICCGLISNASAQQKWNLQSVVEYAMANNITVKLSDVQAKVAEINYKQNKLSQYPTASFSGNVGINSGSTQDPTTFSRTTQTYLSSGLQLQTGADIFNFYSKKNAIAASQWELLAAKAATDKTKYDIALTAANAYLQILLNRSQEDVTDLQIKLTRAQLGIARKQVDAGALPELNATQLEAQLSIDSLNYLTAKGNTALSILVLKSYMNIDAAANFEIEMPAADKIPVEPIASLQPDYVFDLAMKNMPQQRYNDYRLKAAEKSAAAAKGAMYPTFSLYGSLGTNYNNRSQVLTGVTSSLAGIDSLSYVNASTKVYRPIIATIPSYKYNSLFNQLSDNFRQSVGINISVPIFNGGTLKSNYERSKLNIRTVQLQKEQDDQKLKQDIYQAYTAALIAYQKFNSAKKSVDINEVNLGYAQKRYDVGMLGTFDLITTQNNLYRARLEYVSNRFDYIFKMKVLEFYKGQGLKL